MENREYALLSFFLIVICLDHCFISGVKFSMLGCWRSAAHAAYQCKQGGPGGSQKLCMVTRHPCPMMAKAKNRGQTTHPQPPKVCKYQYLSSGWLCCEICDANHCKTLHSSNAAHEQITFSVTLDHPQHFVHRGIIFKDLQKSCDHQWASSCMLPPDDIKEPHISNLE